MAQFSGVPLPLAGLARIGLMLIGSLGLGTEAALALAATAGSYSHESPPPLSLECRL